MRFSTGLGFPPMGNGAGGRRVAVVGGCRTPFCKAGTALRDL